MPNNLFQGLLPDARHAYAGRSNRFSLGRLDDDFDVNHWWTAGFRLIQFRGGVPYHSSAIS